MKSSNLASSPAQSRQTRQQFAKPEDYLSYELGKAVQELPPLYTRLLAGSISLLVFGTLIWANFSKVDEVAVAPGQLIPSTEVRPVRALGDGTVQTINVKEGDHVEKGQVLIERDPGIEQASVDRLAKSAELIQQDLKRLEAERTGETTAGTNLQDQLLTSRLQDYKANLDAALAEVNRQAAIRKAAQVRLSRLQENLLNARTNVTNAKTNLANAKMIVNQAKGLLANARTKEKGLRILLNDGAAPRLDYVDAQNAVIQAQAGVTNSEDSVTNAQDKITEAIDKVVSTEKEIVSQEQEIRQAEEAYQGAVKKAESVGTQRRSEILTDLNKRREEQATTEGQLDQARKERQREIVEAPVTGRIYSIKATRGPVQTGEELLSILPDGQELLLEVKVLNRDIGFIREGMKAKVKMATFPFQEFGTIDGEVVKVSANSINDKDLGLVFPTRIKLNQHSINVHGQKVQLTPGMSASGEVVTRQKSILTFLIEPVTRRFSEAFSVR